jgi:hydrogenase expression/formation protein HypD
VTVANRLADLQREGQSLADAFGASQIKVMEVCGTHTVAAFRSGLRDLLPRQVRLISGPGCPVCVTSQGFIDAAIALAGRPGVVIATYGDMVRVPGLVSSLERERGAGAKVEVVYSVMQALDLARSRPKAEVVFLGVGFETTTPATAWAVARAAEEGLRNFSVFAAHKVIIPAMRALLAGGEVGIDGFLCPGHVSVIIGSDSYRPLVEEYGAPCIVAGFDGYQMLAGIVAILRALAGKGERLGSVYSGAVTPEGNRNARAVIERVFERGDAEWRGLGVIPGSGLAMRAEYAAQDAERKFEIAVPNAPEPAGCRCGQVIKGLMDPLECPLFGRRCTPTTPIGPCMVSREGSCQAWFRHRWKNRV